MTQHNTKPGSRFGQLTITSVTDPYVEPSGHRRKRVRVKCDCGFEFLICTMYLIRGTTTQCAGCTRKSRQSISVGTRFDRLVITGYEREGPRSLVVCLCDCGTVIRRRGPTLKENQTNNCGCRPNGSWTGVGDLSLTFYNRVKARAKERDLPFEVSMEFLWQKLVEQDHRCKLSGLPIHLNIRTAKTSTASVDRINSTKGYTPENVQWLHKDVNLMKLDMTEERFIELCCQVSNHRPLI